jgi:DNA-binding MarR family transcriptional regulator
MAIAAMGQASHCCLDNDCSNSYYVSMSTKAAATGMAMRFDSVEQEAFLNLWRTYDRLRALEDEHFAQYELTPQQYNVLRLLKAEHPATIPTLALADRLVSRAPDITRMLDKLESRGLIARHRPTENRRVVQVSITSVGQRLLGEIAVPLRQCHARQLGHLSGGDLKQLIDLLRAARRPHEPSESKWR